MNVEPPSDPQPPLSEATPTGIQYAIHARTLAEMERAKQRKPYSPLRIALTSLVVLVMLGVFWGSIDFGVRATHRIIDIWLPVMLAPKKPPATDPTQPYLVTVEAGATQSSSSQSRASSSKVSSDKSSASTAH